jgi:D-glycero-D-manno-heptose 1,7-bisphosphate phosphatase
MPDQKHSTVRPPVFLDRDGTIIVEKHYLSDPALVELETGAAEGLHFLQSLGHPLVVVSNQSGIGRGKFALADAHRVNERVAELLAEHGVRIMAWYMCPHAPQDPCTCRKPLPGMPQAAAAEWNLTLAGSYMVGDKQIDVELGQAIGGTGILVTTGHGQADAPWAHAHEVPVCDNLLDAAHLIATLCPPLEVSETHHLRA